MAIRWVGPWARAHDIYADGAVAGVRASSLSAILSIGGGIAIAGLLS